MQNIRIAVIDNGIAEDLLSNPLEQKVYINSKNECAKDNGQSEHTGFIHGTICVLILEKSLPGCAISSVKILDKDGRGKVDKLKPALEWCYQNHISLVNLSFGTTDFRECSGIRNIINHYANRGMIIVAATSNAGFKSYPASFTNVLGVKAGNPLEEDGNTYNHLGVDIVASLEHKVRLNDTDIKPAKSNSYTAPFVTAEIGKKNGFFSDICELKYKSVSFAGHSFSPFIPDWIEAAWVSAKIKRSEAGFYFKEIINKDNNFVLPVDTIIINDREEYDLYKSRGKHVVYLGENPIEYTEKNRFFWSSEQRKQQIVLSQKRDADIDIPVVFLSLDEKADEMLWLGKLKNYFKNDGYNAYTISQKVESVLYDLEYIPKELCNEDNREKIHDFLYWQTYYGQADLIIFCYNKIHSECAKRMADLIVDICGIDEKCNATIYCEEANQCELEHISIKEINKLYSSILQLLLEDSNE